MSNTENSNGRGRSEGSRRHQFSRDNQPERRRQRRKRGDFGSDILGAFRQTITVTKNGAPKKMELFHALAESVARDLLKASLPIKLKAIAQLKSLGLADTMSMERRLDKDRLEFERDQREWEKYRRLVEATEETSRWEKEQLKAQWYAAAKLVVALRKACECGSCDHQFADDLDVIERALTDDLEIDRDVREIIVRLREHQSAVDADTDEDEDAHEYDDDWDDDAEADPSGARDLPSDEGEA